MSETGAGSLFSASMATETSITERFYRDLVEHSPIAVLVCDADGRIVLANRALAGITGRSLSEIIGANLQELFLHGQDIPWEIWRQESLNGSTQPAMLRMHGPGGRSLIVECHGHPIQIPPAVHQPEGSPPRIHLMIQDVTAQHRRLHELQLLHDLDAPGLGEREYRRRVPDRRAAARA